MENIIEGKSTFISILTRSIWGLLGQASYFTSDMLLEDEPNEKKTKMRNKGKSPVGFWSIFTPWHIVIDINKKQITIRKRNWYLFTVQEDVYAFKSVRHVSIQNYLFGADIGIRLFAGTAIVYSISKGKSKQIRDILLNPEWNKTDADVIIDVER